MLLNRTNFDRGRENAVLAHGKASRDKILIQVRPKRMIMWERKEKKQFRKKEQHT